MAWEGTNQRRFPRANYGCVVRVRIKGSVEVFQTKTENIGCGGICVMLPKTLNVFTPVEVEVDLQISDGRIVCDGKIVWAVRKSQIEERAVEEVDTGIEFVNLKPKDKERIEAIVNECLKKSTSTESVS